MKALEGTELKSGYRKFCLYDSTDHNSFLTLVYAAYPKQEAKRHFLDQQEDERECREPSICTTEGEPGQEFEGPHSYLAWAIDPPPPDEPPLPWSYLAGLAGAAQIESDGLLCEFPLGLPQRLGGETQAELESALPGVGRFMREACGLPAEEEAGSGEPTPKAPEQVSSLAGTTDDEAGAEQTLLAYDKAIYEHDYQTACELTDRNYLETLDQPCSQLLAEQLRGFNVTAMGKNLAELEERARQFIGLDISNHSLVWDGAEWLDNPEGGREGYVEEE